MSRHPAIRVLGVVVAVILALSGVIIYKFVSRDTSPGAGWLKVGSVADIQHQGVTKFEHSAYVVSYGDLPVFAFAGHYSDGRIREVVSYCPSNGGFYNESHATQYDIVGRYLDGPDPSSTLPRVAATVVDGDVWVDPEQPVSEPIPGGTEVDVPTSRAYCQPGYS